MNDETKKELTGETDNSNKNFHNEKSLSSINNLTIVDAALQYASKGFYVIPISPISKRPLIKFANRPALTADEIRAIWARYPDANLAIRTVQFFVIDVDRHNGIDGKKKLDELGHPEWFENTLTERTAHNGVHYYFAKPKGLEITQKISLLEGVDLKYHINNYVVAAPSKLGDKHYEWISGRYMKPAPQGLIDFIVHKEHRTVNTSGNMNFNNNRPWGRVTKTGQAITMIKRGFGEKGLRNNNVAFFVGILIWNGVPLQTIGQLAIEANNNTPDPLPFDELKTTIKSVINTDQRNRMNNQNNN